MVKKNKDAEAKKVKASRKKEDVKDVKSKSLKTSEKPKAAKKRVSKAPKKPYKNFPFSKKEIQQALQDSLGNVAKAARSLKYKDGSEVPRTTLDKQIEVHGLKYYANSVKKKIAKAAFDIVQDLGINGRDYRCLFKILDTWGKYIDFVEPGKEVNVNIQTDVWKEVLESIDPQRKKTDGIKAENN